MAIKTETIRNKQTRNTNKLKYIMAANSIATLSYDKKDSII